jgi:Uma2 family endonuclease
MVITQQKITNAEYFALEAGEKRYELHEGVLIEMPSPSPLHNWIVALLVRLLLNYALEQKLGYVFGDNLDYVMDEGLILKPDVSFVAAGRFTSFPRHFDFAPDLAVEVISPSNTASEMLYKVDTYLQYGTRLVWIVDPETRVVVVYRKGEGQHLSALRLNINETLTGEDVLPDFQLALADLFAQVDS